MQSSREEALRSGPVDQVGQGPATFPTGEQLAAVRERFHGQRLALAHEWFGHPLAGSEKVFMSIARLFASMEHSTYTLFDHRPQNEQQVLDMQSSFLGSRAMRKLPRAAMMPAMPLAWRTVGRGTFDTAVISSHAFANRFAARAARAVVYCHSPLRYAWLPEIDARGDIPLVGRPARRVLAHLDHRASRKVQTFIANSDEVRGRIRAFYDADASVVHPPIDTEFFRPLSGFRRSSDLLSVGRFVPYKRHDFALRVAAKLGRRLRLVGHGPDEARLRALAAELRVDIVVDRAASDRDLRAHYRECACLIFPVHEDFGMVPVEAMACGAPVVLIAKGGALDYGDLGHAVQVDDASVDAFAEAVAHAARGIALPVDEVERRFGYRRWFRSLTSLLVGTAGTDG